MDEIDFNVSFVVVSDTRKTALTIPHKRAEGIISTAIKSPNRWLWEIKLSLAAGLKCNIARPRKKAI